MQSNGFTIVSLNDLLEYLKMLRLKNFKKMRHKDTMKDIKVNQIQILEDKNAY